MRKFFELTKPYQFDPTDLTATIYLICTIMGMMNFNVTPLFLLGSAIGTAFCWQAHRINLVVLNISLFALNVVNFVRMF